MQTSTNHFPDHVANEQSMHSTGTFSINFKPVVRAIASLAFEIREENNASRKNGSELAMGLSSMNNDISQNSKVLLGLQRCVQSLEEQQHTFSEQNIRARFLKPLSRKLLGLRKSAGDLMGESEYSYITNIIDDILGDFGIEIIEPKRGDMFDPQIMKPCVANLKSETSSQVVEELLQPGAMSGNYMLEYAQVKLSNQISLIGRCPQQTITN